MPGGLNGQNLKQALISAAPLFSSMAAGYSSGRGPYAYLDQGIAGMQAMQKQKRDEEAAAAAAAAFGGLVPGGMGPAGMSSKGGTSSGGGFAPVPIDPSSPDAIAADTMTALGRGNDWLKYSNQGATRNDHLDAKLVDAMSFLPQMGITMDVISGGQEAAGEGGARKGSVRHDHGMAADVDFYKDGRKLDWNNPADLPLLTQIVQTAKSRGVTGIGAGDDYMGAGRFHVGFGNPAVWGKGGQSANAPAWLVDAYNGAPSGSVTMSAKGEGSVSGVVDPLADPYVQKLMQVMAMPGLTDEQRSVVELQLQTRMGQLTAPNPNAEEDRARERRARDAELLGYGRGTPEWNQYVVTGDVPQSPKPIEVGGVLLDPTGQNILFDSREPPKPDAPTTKTVKLADGSDVMVQWNPETQVWDAAPIPEGGTTGTGAAATTVGQVYNPNEIQSVIGMIDSIYNDPNLPSVVGKKAMLLGGGNDPEAMNSLQKFGYGAEGLDTIERIGQLQSNAWLSARAMLKGGGPITDYESRKAEAAVARLGRAKTVEDYQSALKELRDAITEGEAKLRGAQGVAVGGDQTGAPAAGSAQPGGVLKFDANGNIIP